MTRQEIEHRIKVITCEIGKLNCRLQDCYTARSNAKFKHKKGKAPRPSPAVNAEISRIRTKQNKLNDEKQELLHLLKSLDNSQYQSTFDVLKQRAQAKQPKHQNDGNYNDGM